MNCCSVLISNIELKVAMVEAWILNLDSSTNHWPPELNASNRSYAISSLELYKKIQEGYQRLQQRRALRFGEGMHMKV
jgi:hypothetical protein